MAIWKILDTAIFQGRSGVQVLYYSTGLLHAGKI